MSIIDKIYTIRYLIYNISCILIFHNLISPNNTKDFLLLSTLK
nr:MAG TPA_asm: hypothetical protein [Bacteriophage sp.]